MDMNCPIVTVFLGFVLTFLSVAKAIAETSCTNTIQCPCGSSNTTFKICRHDQSITEITCDRFSQCARCEDYLNECLECPGDEEDKYCEEEKLREVITFCRDPGTDRNGDRNPKEPLIFNSFVQGAFLHYSCKNGYILNGDRSIYCLHSGRWSSEAPTCQPDPSLGECGVTYTDIFFDEISRTSPLYKGDMPWYVTLSIDPRRNSHCSGTLISPTSVITSASCITALGKTVYLYFGRTFVNLDDEDAELQLRISTEIITYTEFSIYETGFDIALVKFAPSVIYTDNIRPVCLPTEQTAKQNLISGAIGYMTQNDYQAKTFIIRQIPLLPQQECPRLKRRGGLSYPNHTFCGSSELASYSSESIRERGSGLVFYDSNTDTYILEGVFFRMFTRPPSEIILLMARIEYYVSWILETI